VTSSSNDEKVNMIKRFKTLMEQIIMKEFERLFDTKEAARNPAKMIC